MTKQIPLNGGKVALVDDADFERLAQHKWSFGGRYVQRQVNGSSVTMHRQILNPPNGLEVDHVNGNTLDNRRANLRICTHAQNMRNRKKQTNGVASAYKGVSRFGTSRRWVARIRVAGRLHRLGRFDTEAEAAIAYNEAAIKLHGEFARLNEVTR